jgi:uncharacterized membrane protein
MTNPQQLQQDLQFIRTAVVRRERTNRGPVAINYIWAIYVLVGYALLDHNIAAAGWFFMVGGIVGGILSSIAGRLDAHKQGEQDWEMGRRALLHFGGGIVVALIGTTALAAVIPELRSTRGSQVLVVMIGVIYFLAGVHFDGYFLWLGPVLVAGGVAVGFIHHDAWTLLGAVIAVGLIIPTLLPSKRTEIEGAAALGGNDAGQAK